MNSSRRRRPRLECPPFAFHFNRPSCALEFVFFSTELLLLSSSTRLEAASPRFEIRAAGKKERANKSFLILSPDMRRDDAFVRLHHVPCERALQPSVGLDHEAAPRAAQERCQGWRGLGGGHFFVFFDSESVEFFLVSKSFEAASSGVDSFLLTFFFLFFFVSTSAFPLSVRHQTLLLCRHGLHVEGPHRVCGRRACRTHQHGPPRPRLRSRNADVVVVDNRLRLFFPARPPRGCCLGPLLRCLLFGGTPHLFRCYAVSDCWLSWPHVATVACPIAGRDASLWPPP